MDRQRVVLTRLRDGYAIRSFDFTSSIFEVFKGKKSRRRAVRFTVEKGYDLINDEYCIPADPILDQEQVTT